MAFEKITENVENISLLADTPAMTSTELKAEFDKGNKTIKTKFNKLVDDLNIFITTLATKAEVKGTLLYDNPTGTTGNITLSDNVENFDYIEIYYKFGQRSDSLKVNEINNKKLTLKILANSLSTFVAIIKEIEITGTQITKTGEYQTSFSGQNITYTVSDGVYIYKVIGYKY